jgi:hypothetical protein
MSDFVMSETNRREINKENEGDCIDDLAEYLEHLSRTTPTTMPEWMN